jgi:hypothetical protein
MEHDELVQKLNDAGISFVEVEWHGWFGYLSTRLPARAVNLERAGLHYRSHGWEIIGNDEDRLTLIEFDLLPVNDPAQYDAPLL